MDDTLPVDHRVHTVKREIVQAHGLNDLQPLVHQGGGVDGDLGTHGPVGVLQRVAGGHALQLRIGHAEERAAGAGQDQPLDLPLVTAALQALKDGGVLAVHRNDLRAVLFGGGHHQLTGTHQRFLVGKGDAPSKADGSQGGFQPHAAHHGGHHGVGFFHLCRRQQTFCSGAHLDIRIT